MLDQYDCSGIIINNSLYETDLSFLAMRIPKYWDEPDGAKQLPDFYAAR